MHQDNSNRKSVFNNFFLGGGEEYLIILYSFFCLKNYPVFLCLVNPIKIKNKYIKQIY